MAASSISVAERVPRAHVLRALVRRDWLQLRSYGISPMPDLVFGFLNLVVYFFISRALHPRVAGQLQGAPTYFAFATGGIILALVLQAGTLSVTRRIREEQLTGTLETLIAQPIGAAELALGIAAFPFLYAVMRALVYLLLAALVLGLSLAHVSWPGLLISLALSGIAFSAIGIALSAMVLVIKRGEAIGSAAVIGLTLLGGAVFPIAVLSSWLKPLTYAVPTRYAFQAVRGSQFGVVSWTHPALALAAFGAVAMPLALAAFAFALRLNARRGSLNQY